MWIGEESKVEIIRAGRLWSSPGGNWCAYCGVLLGRVRAPESPKRGRAFSRDHVRPRCDGGGKTVPSCVACNEQKAARPVSEFIDSQWLEDRRALVRRRYRHEAPWSLELWQAWLST